MAGPGNFGSETMIAGVILALLLAACTSPGALEEDAVLGAASQESLGADESEAATVRPLPAETAGGPEATALAAGELIPAAEVAELLDTLINGLPGEAEAPVARIVEAHDTRFTAVFIELMRARQLGLARNLEYEAYTGALTALTGQDFGLDLYEWIIWYGATALEPPPGFTGWKGQIMARIDPRFAAFLRDEFETTIRPEEIMWGGVLVDGIPALDNAKMVAADEADYLQPWDAVFGLSINGDARAYPLRIMDWHEMANDVVGGVPVSLAYCTLCGAAIAYDGRGSDGVTYDFGSSGFLFRSNKLMYDRQTQTLWNQLTGEPVLGPLVGSGLRLDILPVVLARWDEWHTQHPDTQVLSIDTGFARDYAAGAAYGEYFASAGTMFPVWQRSDALADKEQVYVLRREDGVPKAYPLAALLAEKVVNDELGGQLVVLVAPQDVVSVDGANQRAGAVQYQAGSEVRAYERGALEFRPGPDSSSLLDQGGNTWQVTEAALLGPDGESLPRLGGHLAFWFGVYAFFPNIEVYGE